MAQVYHIRTIDGIVPPMPKKLRIVKYRLDKGAYRTASGDLLRNVVAQKMKFFIEFPPMNKTSIQSLLDLIDKDEMIITYEDMKTSVVKSGKFYVGDLDISPIWIKNEANTDVLYDVFSCNLIEF